jgi:hypothetical protein
MSALLDSGIVTNRNAILNDPTAPGVGRRAEQCAGTSACSPRNSLGITNASRLGLAGRVAAPAATPDPAAPAVAGPARGGKSHLSDHPGVDRFYAVHSSIEITHRDGH